MKIFKIEDYLEYPMPATDDVYRLEILKESDGASELGGILGILPQGAKKGIVPHHHQKRESLILIIKGKAKSIIEGKEYILEANNMIFIPPKKKHQLLNIGKDELRYLEFFTHPPVHADFVD